MRQYIELHQMVPEYIIEIMNLNNKFLLYIGTWAVEITAPVL